jgi:phage tail-like protein
VPGSFALIRTNDQWRRVAHDHTALDGEVVSLAWVHEETVSGGETPLPPGAGLAFDSQCRLYHSAPAQGQVERLLWASEDPLHATTAQETVLELFDAEVEPDLGDFIRADKPLGALAEPRGLAVDEEDRLFIAEAGARRLLIYDLWSRRLLRRVPVTGQPLDLVAQGRTVFVLLSSPPGLLRLEARTAPRPLALPPTITQPTRLAISSTGELFILEKAGGPDARIVSLSRPNDPIEIPGASDIELQPRAAVAATALDSSLSSTAQELILVAARRPKEDFLRFHLSETDVTEISPLKGRDYDGSGIVCTPDGRIGFWTARGFRHAVSARLRYLSQGRVTSFRLDSGEFHTTWGRLFLDACIPKDTAIHVHCVATDEPPDEPTLPPSPPVNIVNMTIARPDLSPPLPPVSLVARADEVTHLLHRRETGPETPWVRPAEDDPFETYEAPILTGPGRYLWVTLELHGNSRSTPRLRALRAEYPTHDYLRRLPKTFSRDEQMASFLQRYLAMFAGFLQDLEGKADARRILIDPGSAPAEILPWLAGFLGLVVDERWSVPTRRALLAEVTWLFRFRGTIPGLTRFLEIYTGAKVIIIEKFRTRGLGGTLGGDPAGLTSNSVLGAGFRVGGAVGESATDTLVGNVDDAFATHAHRFSVIIPAVLSTEQIDVVNHILELHRPAHTLVEVCTVGAGMRVGRGLHVELTSVIGRTGGFSSLQLGGSLLGREAIVGRPEPGTRLGGSRLGGDSRVG